jgi:hypothetical protein
MRVGDVVVPIPPFMLCSGSGYYGCAIVVHANPKLKGFALSSLDGDMIWLTVDPVTDVWALCQADPKLVKPLVEKFQKRYMKPVKCVKRKLHSRG